MSRMLLPDHHAKQLVLMHLPSELSEWVHQKMLMCPAVDLACQQVSILQAR